MDDQKLFRQYYTDRTRNKFCMQKKNETQSKTAEFARRNKIYEAKFPNEWSKKNQVNIFYSKRDYVGVIVVKKIHVIK